MQLESHSVGTSVGVSVAGVVDGMVVGCSVGSRVVNISPQQSRNIPSVVGQQSPVRYRPAQTGKAAHDAACLGSEGATEGHDSMTGAVGAFVTGEVVVGALQHCKKTPCSVGQQAPAR